MDVTFSASAPLLVSPKENSVLEKIREGQRATSRQSVSFAMQRIRSAMSMALKLRLIGGDLSHLAEDVKRQMGNMKDGIKVVAESAIDVPGVKERDAGALGTAFRNLHLLEEEVGQVSIMAHNIGSMAETGSRESRRRREDIDNLVQDVRDTIVKTRHQLILPQVGMGLVV